MDLREVIAAAPRTRLAHLPTPIQPLDRLSRHLGGPRLWAKRDDLTGLGLGGNKVRKLEFVLPDAVARGADVLVTAGVAQSNSVRQIAAGAARAGLDCHVVQFSDREGAVPPTRISGNALIIRLLGATVESVGWSADRNAAIVAAAERLETAGRRPYVVPYGVSNPLGALGYVAAAHEMTDQLTAAELDVPAVVHASGSGGTQAGLAVGFFASDTRVVGVDADAEPDRVHHDVVSIARDLAERHGIDPEAVAATVEVVAGHAGPTYGAVTDEVIEAIDLAARLEGLVLDPVYSGKGLAGLIAMTRAGRFDASDNVLFIHTGGAPGLLATPEIIERFER